MAKSGLSAIRFWAYPAMVIGLWVVVSAFSLTQLTTVHPSLTSRFCAAAVPGSRL
jgi:hypothetical protein